ncbi:MAG: signal peptidase II [Nanoarchaeota archaeon]
MGKKNIFIFSAALIVVVLDQLTKFLIRTNFKLGESIPIIKNIFHFTYVTNTGSAFGLFKSLNWFFMLFSIIVIVAIFYYLRKKIKENEKFLQFAVGLLLGGTIGNFIDRVLIGAVTDFIDFRIWPVFNIADSAVTISVILLVVMLWKK